MLSKATFENIPFNLIFDIKYLPDVKPVPHPKFKLTLFILMGHQESGQQICQMEVCVLHLWCSERLIQSVRKASSRGTERENIEIFKLA